MDAELGISIDSCPKHGVHSSGGSACGDFEPTPTEDEKIVDDIIRGRSDNKALDQLIENIQKKKGHDFDLSLPVPMFIIVVIAVVIVFFIPSFQPIKVAIVNGTFTVTTTLMDVMKSTTSIFPLIFVAVMVAIMFSLIKYIST